MSGVGGPYTFNDELAGFWEENHRSGDIDWLTFSHPLDVIKDHELGPLLEIPSSIMEIGIGNGGLCCYLSDKHNVLAVDISPYALKQVEAFVMNTLLTGDLDRVPTDYFDLIISHLVFQHCPDDSLTWIMQNVIRALKPHSGVFSFQFAYMIPEHREKFDGNVPICNQDIGVYHYYRSVYEMKEIVKAAGGKVQRTWIPRGPFYDGQLGWRIMRVNKDYAHGCDPSR